MWHSIYNEFHFIACDIGMRCIYHLQHIPAFDISSKYLSAQEKVFCSKRINIGIPNPILSIRVSMFDIYYHFLSYLIVISKIRIQIEHKSNAYLV